MNIEHYISNRYLIAKKTSGTSLVTKVAIAGLILAVSSLITVLSVMNGFHKEIRQRILSSISHGYIANDSFDNVEYAKSVIDNHKEVIASNVYVERYALITHKGNSEGVTIRGIDPKAQQTTNFFSNFKGSNALNSGEIVIGIGLADSLNAYIGDDISIIIPKIRQSIFGVAATVKSFRVSGIFDGGLSEYDTTLALINIKDAQTLYKTKNTIDGIRIKLTDMLLAQRVINELMNELGSGYYGVSWQTQKKNFFTALQLEKRMITIVLSLIIAVAVFNVVSMMIMIVKDKKYDIAILRTLGFNAKQIRRTMFYLSIKIGFFAITLGTVIGIIISYFIADIFDYIENVFGTKIFPDDVFYINSFPSAIIVSDLVMVISISLLLVVLSSIYPARNAAKINISDTLKEL